MKTQQLGCCDALMSIYTTCTTAVFTKATFCAEEESRDTKTPFMQTCTEPTRQ